MFAMPPERGSAAFIPTSEKRERVSDFLKVRCSRCHWRWSFGLLPSKEFTAVTKANSPCCYKAGPWRVIRTLYLRCCVWEGIAVLVNRVLVLERG